MGINRFSALPNYVEKHTPQMHVFDLNAYGDMFKSLQDEWEKYQMIPDTPFPHNPGDREWMGDYRKGLTDAVEQTSQTYIDKGVPAGRRDISKTARRVQKDMTDPQSSLYQVMNRYNQIQANMGKIGENKHISDFDKSTLKTLQGILSQMPTFNEDGSVNPASDPLMLTRDVKPVEKAIEIGLKVKDYMSEGLGFVYVPFPDGSGGAWYDQQKKIVPMDKIQNLVSLYLRQEPDMEEYFQYENEMYNLEHKVYGKSFRDSPAKKMAEITNVVGSSLGLTSFIYHHRTENSREAKTSLDLVNELDTIYSLQGILGWEGLPLGAIDKETGLGHSSSEAAFSSLIKSTRDALDPGSPLFIGKVIAGTFQNSIGMGALALNMPGLTDMIDLPMTAREYIQPVRQQNPNIISEIKAEILKNNPDFDKQTLDKEALAIVNTIDNQILSYNANLNLMKEVNNVQLTKLLHTDTAAYKKLKAWSEGETTYRFGDFQMGEDFKEYMKVLNIQLGVTGTLKSKLLGVGNKLTGYAQTPEEIAAVEKANSEVSKILRNKDGFLNQYLNANPDFKKVMYRAFSDYMVSGPTKAKRQEAYDQVVGEYLRNYDLFRTLTSGEHSLSLAAQEKLNTIQKLEYRIMQEGVVQTTADGKNILVNKNLDGLKVVPLTDVFKGSKTDEEYGRANKPLLKQHLSTYSGIEFKGFTARGGKIAAVGILRDSKGELVPDGYVTYEPIENMTDVFYNALNVVNPATFSSYIETMLKASELDSPDGKAVWNATGMFGPDVEVKISKGLSPAGMQYRADMKFKDGSSRALSAANIFDFSTQMQNISATALGTQFGRKADQIPGHERVANKAEYSSVLSGLVTAATITNLAPNYYGSTLTDKAQNFHNDWMNVIRKESAGTYAPDVSGPGTALGTHQELVANRTDMSADQYIGLGISGQAKRGLDKFVFPRSNKIKDGVDLYLAIFMPGAVGNTSIKTFDQLLSLEYGDAKEREKAWDKNAWSKIPNVTLSTDFRPVLEKWLKN